MELLFGLICPVASPPCDRAFFIPAISALAVQCDASRESPKAEATPELTILQKKDVRTCGLSHHNFEIATSTIPATPPQLPFFSMILQGSGFRAERSPAP